MRPDPAPAGRRLAPDLEANGVTRSDRADKPLTQAPIADEAYGSVLVFRDRDNIQLELFSPPPSA